MTHDTRWDHALQVTGGGEGLIGQAGAVLLRKLADQVGLTAGLGPALARAGKFPLVDRGVALVSMAEAIALGATSMNDIILLALLFYFGHELGHVAVQAAVATATAGWPRTWCASQGRSGDLTRGGYWPVRPSSRVATVV